MARIRDRYPNRGNDPLYRSRSYVDRREGATDTAKERRNERALARAPLPVPGEAEPPPPDPQAQVVNVAVAWNPTSIAAGAEAGVVVTASGVANDGTWTCNASFTSLSTAGNDQWFITAWPRAANQAIVRILNMSGNPHDLASGTVRLHCRQEV